MLDSTQIQAREIIMACIEKEMEKLGKKVEKEKAKKNSASVTYKGDVYTTEADLQDAYACDMFTSATYDRLVEKLQKARGNVESYEMTPTEMLVFEMSKIRNNFLAELQIDKFEKDKKEKQDARAEELSAQGYSYKEIEAILGNEELMRYE